MQLHPTLQQLRPDPNSSNQSREGRWRWQGKVKPSASKKLRWEWWGRWRCWAALMVVVMITTKEGWRRLISTPLNPQRKRCRCWMPQPKENPMLQMIDEEQMQLQMTWIEGDEMLLLIGVQEECRRCWWSLKGEIEVGWDQERKMMVR